MLKFINLHQQQSPFFFLRLYSGLLVFTSFLEINFRRFYFPPDILISLFIILSRIEEAKS